VIHAASAAALGSKAAKQNYIPTPDAVKAKGVKYDELYPKAFSQPSTYIRFSSTVEDTIGVAYCMNDDDVDVLSKLNEGKDVNGQPRKDKLSQCSEDTFEEVMNFFEETSSRLQPFANVDNAPFLTLEEMERSVDDTVSAEAQKWLKHIYQYWVSKKGNRPIMPAIKVRVLDTSTEADDADPYVCFRRREVRQTRKTRGRDAQVVEKLKKLRLELEQARQLVQLVVQREQLNKEDLEISRKVFEERRKLKDVKVNKQIIGEKGEDEELLVNQKVYLPVISSRHRHANIPSARSQTQDQARYWPTPCHYSHQIWWRPAARKRSGAVVRHSCRRRSTSPAHHRSSQGSA
jgi:enhancer of polycomb-like protein